MPEPVVVVGVGEMGGVFARGFLRIGHPVVPVLRDSNIDALAAAYAHPELVLVAVAESDLPSTLADMPDSWRTKMVLLQNEMLPRDFEPLSNPTIISVWFEKKKGQDVRPIIPSPVFGPKAEVIQTALAALDIPVIVLEDANQLEFELVVKNLYILTTNIAGIRTGGTVGLLWQDHEAFTRDVADNVIDLQEGLTGHTYDRSVLLTAMLAAFAGDTDHKCMGRSAPARLKRALEFADKLQLEVPVLREINADDVGKMPQ